ncbi:MAG TPA: aspartate--tRNA ligase [Solirubrobacteraceae bacterium]|nr:aspartate--tRNA ligase [Solirubrobacteraceae bacterium]
MKQPPQPNAYRTAWAGDLRAAEVGSELTVAGWIHRRRDHGGLIFIDLRDRSGLLQLVFHPESAPQAHAAAHDLRSEGVISVTGRLVARDPDTVNPSLPTGEVELAVSELRELASSPTPPFPIDEDVDVDETLRLRHRSLDLRREPMRDAMILRHEIVRTIRETLAERDFLEIETPILTRATPEGARDFLVPARTQRGSFYALPQSPQLFKQLLVLAGFERYFQIARCFRDEDTRADRQPEFTQLDVELSFVTEDEVLAVTEAVMARVFEVAGFPVAPAPWPQLRYADAVARYGSDRPDTRFGLEIADVSQIVAGSEFKVFESVLAGGGVVRAINAGSRELSRAEQDGLSEIVQRFGAKAVAPIYAGEGGWRGNLAKFFAPEQIAGVNAALHASDGDLLLFVADREHVAARALGALRLELGERFGLIDHDRHDVLWVRDFPMFEWSETERRFVAMHHPFTAPAPAPGASELDFTDPGALLSRGYDLVCDGVELGGGSIRIHTPEVQEQVFKVIGLSEEEGRARFGFLLDALRYGAPPHGGIALGIDRIVAICAGRDSIREVIAFPKTATGGDPLTGAPAPVDATQLRELGLRLA